MSLSFSHRVLCSVSFVLAAAGVQAKTTATDTVISGVHTDFIRIENKQLLQDVYITARRPMSDTLMLTLHCYRHNGSGDSLLVYRYRQTIRKLKQGTSLILLGAGRKNGACYLQPGFEQVLRQTGLIPQGHYRLHLQLSVRDTLFYGKAFLWSKDSLVALHTPLHRSITDLLSGSSLKATEKSALVIQRQRFRLKRQLAKKGMTVQQSRSKGKEMLDISHGNWYLGRYEVPSDTSFAAALQQERVQLENPFSSLTTNGLSDHPSLMSQFKDIRKQKKEDKQLQGTLSLNTQVANNRDPYAAQDNFYQELRGNFDFMLGSIPVGVAAFYTTQDRNREAKASTLHFRYDAEKAREQLLQLISAYRRRFDQTKAQSANLDMIYGNYIAELSQLQAQQKAGLQQQLALPDAAMGHLDEARLKALVQQQADSSGPVSGVRQLSREGKAVRQSATAQYEHALEQYRRIQATEQQIRKYRFLLEQYRNTQVYDSLLAYDKLQDLKDLEQASAKDLAKSASGLLPDNKAKQFVTGLTGFDAGMFPKYISDYTMSGQLLKGLDMSYDIGFAAAGAGYGRTEYISREGQKENYRSYSARLKFKPIARQQLGLVYFGYAPEASLLQDKNFLQDQQLKLSGFRNPVHILSLDYEARISEQLRVTATGARSVKQGQSAAAGRELSEADRSAFNIKMEGRVPLTPLTLEAGYEQVGQYFENNTLPVIMAGTKHISLKGKTDWFRGFLSTGIEYNYLVQSNFSSQAANARWGFELATHSRRFPSVSLSYKPFSSFRSYDDTMAIAQKPIIGSVWTGRISYQLKRPGRSLRFTLLCNRNSSIMDTGSYNSSVYQFNVMYTVGTTSCTINIGSSDIRTERLELANAAFNQSRFINLSAHAGLLPRLTASGGTDLGMAAMGLSRYGCFAAAAYTFKKKPLMVRSLLRYNRYRLTESVGWQELYAAGLELNWRFLLRYKE